MINRIKTLIIKWAFSKQIKLFEVDENNNLIRVHLNNGYILETEQDVIKSDIENLIKSK